MQHDVQELSRVLLDNLDVKMKGTVVEVHDIHTLVKRVDIKTMLHRVLFHNCLKEKWRSVFATKITIFPVYNHLMFFTFSFISVL